MVQQLDNHTSTGAKVACGMLRKLSRGRRTLSNFCQDTCWNWMLQLDIRTDFTKEHLLSDIKNIDLINLLAQTMRLLNTWIL